MHIYIYIYIYIYIHKYIYTEGQWNGECTMEYYHQLSKD